MIAKYAKIMCAHTYSWLVGVPTELSFKHVTTNKWPLAHISTCHVSSTCFLSMFDQIHLGLSYLQKRISRCLISFLTYFAIQIANYKPYTRINNIALNGDAFVWGFRKILYYKYHYISTLRTSVCYFISNATVIFILKY